MLVNILNIRKSRQASIFMVQWMSHFLHDIHHPHVCLNATYEPHPFSKLHPKKLFKPLHNDFHVKGSHKYTTTWKLISCFTRTVYGLIIETYLNQCPWYMNMGNKHWRNDKREVFEEKFYPPTIPQESLWNWT